MTDHVELIAIDYPGHGHRIGEPFATDAREIAREIAAALAASSNLPVCLFGHSLGALIAFETALLLERAGSGPQLLFASGSAAPGVAPVRPIHTLPNEEFAAAIRRYNGVPKGALEHEQLRALFLPVLRADFRIFETYQPQPGVRVRCPVVALGGDADPWVPVTTLDAWRGATTAAFATHVFRGDHFYMLAAKADLLVSLLGYVERMGRTSGLTTEPEARI